MRGWHILAQIGGLHLFIALAAILSPHAVGDTAIMSRARSSFIKIDERKFCKLAKLDWPNGGRITVILAYLVIGLQGGVIVTRDILAYLASRLQGRFTINHDDSLLYIGIRRQGNSPAARYIAKPRNIMNQIRGKR